MLLIFKYEVGSGDAKLEQEVYVDDENPFTKRFVSLLNDLKPTKNHWGIILEKNRFKLFYDEGQLNKTDYDFLKRLMFGPDDKEDTTFIVGEDEEVFADAFLEGIRTEYPWSFLVFIGVDLKDED